jgi:hypothetical protein
MIRLLELKLMRWTGYAAHAAGKEMHIIRGFMGKPEGKKHLEDLDIDGRVL